MTTVRGDSETGVDPTPKDVKKSPLLPSIGHYKPILKDNTDLDKEFSKVQGCCNEILSSDSYSEFLLCSFVFISIVHSVPETNEYC